MSKLRTSAIESLTPAAPHSGPENAAVSQASFVVVPRFNMSTLITMIETMRIAGEASHVVAGIEQLGHQPSAHVAGGADDRDLHEEHPWSRSMPRGCGRPVRLRNSRR